MNNLVATTDLLTIEPPRYVAEIYKPFHERLEMAIAESRDVAYNIQTKHGMEVAKLKRALFRTIRTDGEKERAARKAPIIEIGKLLDAKYKEMVAQIEPYETRFDNDIKVEEKRLDDEKAARIKAESEESARVQGLIDNIKGFPLKAIDLTSGGIQEYLIDALEGMTPDSATFGDRFVEAEVAINTSLTQLRGMLAGKQAQEQLAEQQAAQAKLEESARLQREADEKKAREAEAERIQDEREQIERDRAELAKMRGEAEARQRMLDEAEAKARADAEAKMRAEQEAQRAAEAKKAAQEAAAMAEQAKIADLQKTLDRGEEIEASRKNAQLKAQEQPFKSGGMPVKTNDSRDYVEHKFGFQIPQANRPSRSEMLSVLGSTFGGDADTALGWILAEFRGDIEFAARREVA